jgi:hypothetical protein
MTEAQPTPNLEIVVENLRKRTRRMLIVFTSIFALLAAALACFGFLVWKKSKSIDKGVEDVAFDQFANGYTEGGNLVTPEVNTIQFLRRGYSISFDSVQYTQEGLALSGTIGNPNQLWIGSLALKFAARPYVYTFRDKWRESYYNSGFFSWTPLGTSARGRRLLVPSLRAHPLLSRSRSPT